VLNAPGPPTPSSGVRCALGQKSADAKCYEMRPVTARRKFAVEDGDPQDRPIFVCDLISVGCRTLPRIDLFRDRYWDTVERRDLAPHDFGIAAPNQPDQVIPHKRAEEPPPELFGSRRGRT